MWLRVAIYVFQILESARCIGGRYTQLLRSKRMESFVSSQGEHVHVQEQLSAGAR
jgi:hypothetical protein